MDIIVETDTTAIIYYEFSRYTADDEPYQSYQWYATLLKNPEGKWPWSWWYDILSKHNILVKNGDGVWLSLSS